MISRNGAKELLLGYLRGITTPIPAHEIQLCGISPNSISSRLSELQAEGRAKGEYYNGERFKRWRAFDGVPTTKKRRMIVASVFSSYSSILYGYQVLLVKLHTEIPVGSKILIDMKN